MASFTVSSLIPAIPTRDRVPVLRQKRSWRRAILGFPRLAWSRISRLVVSAPAAALAVSFVFLGLAYWLTFAAQLYGIEAMGRSVDVWQIFKEGNWRSASFGFLLPPLPTVLQLPLSFIPALRQAGFAGNVVSAFAAGAAFFALYRILHRFQLGRAVKWTLLLGFLLNPLVWLYASNGAGEMLFVAFVLLSLDQTLAFAANRAGGGEVRYQAVVLLGFFAGLAVLARYAGALLVPVWLGFLWWQAGRDQRVGFGRVEAVSALFLLPVSFFVGLWLLSSALITGDPIYAFTHHEEAAIRQGFGDPILARTSGLSVPTQGVVEVARSGGLQLLQVQPIFTVLLVAAVALARRDRRATLLAAVGLTLVLGSLILLPIRGMPLSLKDLLLAVPLSIAGIGWLLAYREPKALPPIEERLDDEAAPPVESDELERFTRSLGLRTLGEAPPAPVESVEAAPPARILQAPALRLGLVGLALVAPVIMTAGMLNAEESTEWTGDFLRALAGNQTRQAGIWRTERQIADIATRSGLSHDVLIDDLVGYRIIFLSNRPERFVTRANSDFNEVLRSPSGKVSSVLLTAPGPSGPLDAVGQAYPGLYAFGADWAIPVAEWRDVGWRLFSVPGRPGQGQNNVGRR